MKFILFYSLKCKNSINMWNILESENLLSIFQKINIDDLRIEDLQAMNISHVPAIIIVNQNNSKVLKQAREAFVWLRELIKNRKMNLDSHDAGCSRGEIKDYKTYKNIKEYLKNEMSEVCDRYAFLKDSSPQEQNFYDLQKNKKDKIVTLQEIEPLSGNELKEEIMKKNSLRENQMSRIKKEIKENHIDILVDQT